MISTKRRLQSGSELPTTTLPPNSETSSSNESSEVIMGLQLLDQAIAEPTMDRYLDRSPKLNSRVDYEELVRILQRKRAIFITAEQKRKEPKIEGEEVEQTQD